MLCFSLLLSTCAATIYGLTISLPRVPISHLTPNISLQLPAGLQRPRNTTSSPLNFLGVQCYHNLPETVTVQACQPLFAKLVAGGHVYDKYQMWNGWTFQAAYAPCVIRIESPAREDRLKKVGMSMSQIILLATEVLEACRETGTGGANVFEGNWRVVVTKNARRGGSIYGGRAGGRVGA